ncbi:MAG: bifunctional hydroxymethylpyrimidine kinase/phosphomethylpyrimidine kinase [Chloroflexota bacterium]|nr:MAG: bifunctional hydroxymethylpyrimidine kinase/phosphomethylpyrimidine kinase [Chloroflexota bacterium]
MAKIDVVGFGAMNIDGLYRVDELIVDGEQVVTDFNSLPGGSAANTIYGLAKLGVKTGFVGAVGNDEAGKELLDDFKTAAVDTGQIRVKEAATGSTICLSDKLGRRAIYVSPGANSLLSSKDVDVAYLNQTQLVHLTSFADDEQFKLQVDLVKKLKNSVKVSLSPGMLYAPKGLKVLMPVLERAQVVFTNRDEIEGLTGRYFKAGAKELVRLGCRIVVVTLGKGLAEVKVDMVTAYICDGENEYEIEPEELNPKSTLETTGAGDAFAAGFLFGFLKGKKVEECGLLGDIMAGFAIGETGARAGLPTLAQLSQKYLKRSGRRL